MQAYQDNISAKVNGVLTPILGVQVTITDVATGKLATIYSDNGVTQIDQPLTTTETGYFSFSAANGHYSLSFSSAQVKLSPRDVRLYDPADDAPLTQTQAAAATGASKIGIGTETVENALNALQLADYTALRAYSGPRQSTYVTGYLITAAPSGIAGMFTRDDSDTTSADNGGTIIVDASNRRWKRVYTGMPNVLWFGAKGNNAAADTAAFTAAENATTGSVEVTDLGFPYILNQARVLGGSAKARGYVGVGMPIIRFTGLPANTDAVTLSGYQMRQVEMRNIIIDANQSARRPLVLTASDHPIIMNVVTRNSLLEGFGIVVTAPNYVENGIIDISIENAGLHGILMSLGGTGDAFINEMLWLQIEQRGVSKNAAGGNAIRMTSTATGAGSKFSNHKFLKTNFDAQYVSGTNKPSLNVVEIDSGIAENFMFTVGGWENTGAGDISGGYAFAVSGSGAWGGLIVDALIANARWGNLMVQSAITAVFERNYSFNYTRVSGPLRAPTNPAFGLYQSAGKSNATGDGTAYRIGFDGSTTVFNKHSADTIGAGIFTTPEAGVYDFNALVTLNGMAAAHNYAELSIVIAGGSTVGTYQVDAKNPYANADGGPNCRMGGSLLMHVDAGVLVYATVFVSGWTKTVGVLGGAVNFSRFSGRFEG